MPRFANYLQDHMVLQRAPHKSIVWGFGDPSTLTTLFINGKVYTNMSQAQSTNAQNESIWEVVLDPVEDEGPFDIHVSQSLANGTVITITLHDVLFGDVWICSGQSNMELTVSLIYNASIEIANSINFPKVRIFTSALIPSDKPEEELLGISLNWSIPSPKTVGGPDWQYMSAVCWLYGRMIHQALGGRPMGLVATSWGGTFIEIWMPPQALLDCNITNATQDVSDYLPMNLYENENHPLGWPLNHSALYNSMIYPFTRMVIYGVVWYQGEQNWSYNRDKYACSFSRLIYYWRHVWYDRTNGLTNLVFPFGFVQLSTNMNNSQGVGGFPWIRWHQTFDVGYVPNDVVPRIFMAVTCDLRDDPNGVHPRYKHDVGYRLSRSGLAIAYEQDVEFQGPIVQNVTYKNGSSTVDITYTAVSAIELRNTNGFEVCCQGDRCRADSLWVPANITSKNKLTITLTISDSCVGQSLYGLRYLWRETPCPFKQAAIYSATDANLPSPPYLKLF